jgi:hypothetical protein
MKDATEDSLDEYFFAFSLVLHGFSALILSLALNHQRKYRSTVPPRSSQGSVNASVPAKGEDFDPIYQKYGWLKSYVGWGELIFISLFILYIAFLVVFLVERDSSHHSIWSAILVATFGLQRVPVLLLVFIIIFQRFGSGEGPTIKSKIYLLIAAVLSIVNDLPLYYWAQILPGNCVFWVASWVDFVHVLYFISLFFFFMFIRSEYLRNMEECIWTTVNQIQDTFDYRPV